MGNRTKESIFRIAVSLVAASSLLFLLFIVYFIARESWNFFQKIDIASFVFGAKWRPVSKDPAFGIFPIIMATLYTSAVALAISLPIGVGSGLFIAIKLSGEKRELVKSTIGMLSGIPSVVYGFIGLLVVVRFFETSFSMASGESVLAGGIVLAAMVLPYMVSTCEDSMEKIYRRYKKESDSLGVSDEYFIRRIVLKESRNSVVAGTILSFGRAMGETMAVMMVIGNAPIMPQLFGKCQTISSLIALEMGMAEVGSDHYHALFAAGFMLIAVLTASNAAFHFLKKKL